MQWTIQLESVLDNANMSFRTHNNKTVEYHLQMMYDQDSYINVISIYHL